MGKEPTIISKKVLQLLNERGISANKLQNDLELSNNAVTYWKSGRSSPSQRTLQKLAEYFQVPLSYFYNEKEALPTNAKPLDSNFRRLPVIGTIRAGYGGEAIEEFTGEFQVFPADLMRGYGTDELFVLEIRGDSMFPYYMEGDRVLIHKQTSVDSGTVAAVLYDGEEATLKKVTYEPNCDWVILTPLNPLFKPLKIQGPDLQNCRVLGKVISLFREI